MSHPSLPPDRRSFLAWASAASAVLAAHGWGMPGASPAGDPLARGEAGGPRIRRLELLTAAPLAAMKELYHRLLGLRVVEETSARLSIEAGATRLTFVTAPAEVADPFYHFAFDIPENKIRAAHRWQQQRTPLIPIPGRLRDPEYPDDVVDYSHWNAHSIFFFDPAGNVVEYIARHDLNNAAAGAFGSGDILYASEIAFLVDDVAATASTLKEVAGVVQYRGASDQFAAVGDEHGLLLVMQRGRVISFDAPTEKAVAVYPTTAAIRGARRTRYVFPEFPYEISVEASP